MAVKKRKLVRKPRKALTEQEVVSIALTRFSDWPFKSVKSIAIEFGRDPAVVSRAIAQAFREKLVRVTETSKNAKRPIRIPELERQVRDRFDHLSSCIVIEKHSTANSVEQDDKLHQELGKAMAALIAEGSMFRDGDVIGVSSGRGIYHTIRELGDYPPLRARVSLISLTGTVYVRDHSEQINLLLDADIHLSLFGLHFARPITLHPLSLPIVYPYQDHRPDSLMDNHLTKIDWGRRSAIHALLGVGVLSKGHRFYKEVKADVRKKSIILRPIYKFLDPLVKVCEEMEAKHDDLYCPVGDICNRLFYIPPPRWTSLSRLSQKRMEEKVKHLLQEINARLVTINENQLKQIDSLFLVAGGQKKAPAIRQLFSEGYPIHCLCTDQAVAEELLNHP